MVRQGDIVTPHVKLPLPQAQDSTQYRSTVYTDAHVEIDFGGVTDVPDSLDHVQTHFDAAVRVI